MKNKSLLPSKLVITAFLLVPTFALATDLNYLPDDVYIKQQEEKSALEYRIRTLESSLSGSPTISISTIKARIAELEQEMQTEINYVTGLYAHNGIINQLPSAISKIEAKYEPQIESLEEQKEEYEDMLSEEKDAKNEIRKLQSQLNLLNEKLEQMEYQTSVVATASPIDDLEIPSAIQMFEYLDSLPLDEAGETYRALKVQNPELYREVEYITNLKYPHGKPGSALHDEYLESLNTGGNITQSVTPTTPAPKATPVTKEVPIVSKPKTDQTEILVSNENTATTSESGPIQENKAQQQNDQIVPEPDKTEKKPPTIWVRIAGFFKKFWF